MKVKELRLQYGMSRKEFSEYFEISYRTIQKWELGERNCPEHLFKLMQYKLKTEFQKEDAVFLIFKDSIDDACEIKGYIIGTPDDACEYCNNLNKDVKYGWRKYECEILKNLNENKKQ